MPTRAQRLRRRRYRQRRATRRYGTGGGSGSNIVRKARAFTRNVIYDGRPTGRQRPNVRRNRMARRGTKPFSTIGRELGGIIGLPGVGRIIGSGIGRIFGSGDYSLSNVPTSNTLYGTMPPAFGSTSGATTIRHREYVTDIMSSVGFVCSSYDLQPGNSVLFPWLSNIVQNYEQYRFKGLVLEFKSTSANALNSTNTALGTIGIVTQYDVNNPDFTTKQQAENYAGSQAVNPSQSMLHFVECAPRSGVLDKYYIRGNVVPAGEDQKFFDMGKVCLFSQGSQAVANIGELWVSYDIELFMPKQATFSTVLPLVDMARQNAVTNTSAVNIFQSSTMTLNTLGCYMGLQGSVMCMNIPASAPSGRYLFLWVGRGTNVTWSVVGTAPTYTGGTPVAYWNNGVDSFARCAIGPSGASDTAFWSFIVDHVFGTLTYFSTTATMQATASCMCNWVMVAIPAGQPVSAFIDVDMESDLHSQLYKIIQKLGYKLVKDVDEESHDEIISEIL